MVDFHMDDGDEWVGLNKEKASQLDAVEKGTPKTSVIPADIW